ncbi:hypothetical protein TrST_g1749 [Triparma strigata]|uniref:alpha-1,2-Mannosidase n=1 Tax=Triparma strigata TaxID=1606541 RepID=A0A9W7F4T0_9STRA|nr:hypothetical protein TrST_g1749 [Triparma strigata]
MVTLIDTMDTLYLMGNYTEFFRNVERLRGMRFGVDQNVSVFETNIRVLGGLMGAHFLATETLTSPVPVNSIWDGEGNVRSGPSTDGDCCSIKGFCNGTSYVYDGVLVSLMEDLGTRILPAFDTDTGIPYGTVNLVSGVPKGETKIASLAGAGSLSIEMEALSRLTGDGIYGRVGRKSVKALWRRRNAETGLVGKHVDVGSGRWVETVSGVGSNSDSFYEYLLKYSLLFPEDEDFWIMFQDVWSSVEEHVKQGLWYGDVDMARGNKGGSRTRFESLASFVPGLQVLLGELPEASKSLNAFYAVRSKYNFLPERFDYEAWDVEGGGSDGAGQHPLRPEIYESAYLLGRALKAINGNDGGWLEPLEDAIRDIEKYTRTDCGYASIENVVTKKLKDDMPSYFLSETLKYLYLAFDDDNKIHEDGAGWIFTTEAHPIKWLPDLDKEAKEKAVKDDFHTKAQNRKMDELQKTEIAKAKKSIADKKQRLKKSRKKEKQIVAALGNGKDHIMNFLEEIYTDDEDVVVFKPNPDFRSDSESFDWNYRDSAGSFYVPTKSCPNLKHPKYKRLHAQGRMDYDRNFDPKKRVSEYCIDGTKASDLAKSGSSSSLGPSQQQQQQQQQQQNDGPQQTRFTMDGLGDFDVTSFVDGFLVEYVQTGEVIEISSVKSTYQGGIKEYIQVHASNRDEMTGHTQVKASVGDFDGNVFDCEVAVEGEAFPCSVASYGKTRIETMIEKGNVAAVGRIEVAVHGVLEGGCGDAGGGREGGDIKMVKRGQCTFEAKTLQQAPFKGLIIVNSEDNRFIMAESEDVNKLDPRRNSEKNPITVMVSSSDGEKLYSKLQAKAKAKESSGQSSNDILTGVITVVKQDNSKIFKRGSQAKKKKLGGKQSDTADLEYDEVVQFGDISAVGKEPPADMSKLRWPIVQTEKKAIQIMSRTRTWGLRMAKVEEDKYQLFVMKVGES